MVTFRDGESYLSSCIIRKHYLVSNFNIYNVYDPVVNETVGTPGRSERTCEFANQLEATHDPCATIRPKLFSP